MNYSKKAKQLLFFLKEKAISKISIENLSEEKKECDFFCISLSARFSKRYLYGYGQSQNRDKAIFIALMELIERYIFEFYSVQSYQDYGRKNIPFVENVSTLSRGFDKKLKTTNGLSVHFHKKKAIENSLDELIERHVILKALASEVIPTKLSPKFCPDLTPVMCEQGFYAWRGPLGRYVVLIRKEKNGKTVFGFGCNKNFKRAINKAYSEFYPRRFLFAKNNFSNKALITTNTHFLYHWENDTPWTDNFFGKSVESSSLPAVDTKLCKDDFLIGELKLCKELKKIGVVATVANSLKVQQLFTGKWTADTTNNKTINIEKLFPPEIHMIG